MNSSDLPVDRGETRAMNSGGPGAGGGGGYAYRRCYLDEDVWEEVDAATVRRALGEAYRDVSLALDFLHEAGSIRTLAAVFEVRTS